ncbi:MAG TPA: hypothetical protein VGH86_07765 [Phenylobacterium sp.]|jgi:hypothetical protein
MTTWASEAAATANPIEPSSLLKLVAGEFAARVADMWPAPHAEFLAAAAARRHLVCLAMALGADVAAHRDSLLTHRMRRLIGAVAPAAPEGLARALERMGEVAWSACDYRELLRLLADRQAAKVLRHAEVIEVETIQRMVALPAPMATSVGLATALNAGAVEALREAYNAMRFRDGAPVAEAAAARWSRMPTAKALRVAVKDDLCPELPAPPHPGTARLRPLATKADLRDAARRYRNCVVDYAAHAASGWSAIYEWPGPPGAVIEVSRDHVFGWRLDQARMADNVAVPEALREEIASALALMGMHVGRSGWELDRALAQIDGRPFPMPTVEQTVAQVFGDE